MRPKPIQVEREKRQVVLEWAQFELVQFIEVADGRIVRAIDYMIPAPTG